MKFHKRWYLPHLLNLISDCLYGDLCDTVSMLFRQISQHLKTWVRVIIITMKTHYCDLKHTHPISLSNNAVKRERHRCVKNCITNKMHSSEFPQLSLNIDKCAIGRVYVFRLVVWLVVWQKKLSEISIKQTQLSSQYSGGLARLFFQYIVLKYLEWQLVQTLKHVLGFKWLTVGYGSWTGKQRYG